MRPRTKEDAQVFCLQIGRWKRRPAGSDCHGSKRFAPEAADRSVPEETSNSSRARPPPPPPPPTKGFAWENFSSGWLGGLSSKRLSFSSTARFLWASRRPSRRRRGGQEHCGVAGDGVAVPIFRAAAATPTPAVGALLYHSCNGTVVPGIKSRFAW